jgi:4-aminobutyrate aminotransferase-like enzyme
VEAALKTAAIRTGRTGILAFEGAYHGLTYGALAATWRPDFRAPFQAQLFAGVRFAPFPAAAADAAIDAVRACMREAEATPHPVGAVIVEPILGRGGLVVPPPGFLAGLRELCDGHRTLLSSTRSTPAAAAPAAGSPANTTTWCPTSSSPARRSPAASASAPPSARPTP